MITIICSPDKFSVFSCFFCCSCEVPLIWMVGKKVAGCNWRLRIKSQQTKQNHLFRQNLVAYRIFQNKRNARTCEAAERAQRQTAWCLRVAWGFRRGHLSGTHQDKVRRRAAEDVCFFLLLILLERLLGYRHGSLSTTHMNTKIVHTWKTEW